MTLAYGSHTSQELAYYARREREELLTQLTRASKEEKAEILRRIMDLDELHSKIKKED